MDQTIVFEVQGQVLISSPFKAASLIKDLNPILGGDPRLQMPPGSTCELFCPETSTKVLLRIMSVFALLDTNQSMWH